MQIGESYFYEDIKGKSVLVLQDSLNGEFVEEISKYSALRIIVRRYMPWGNCDFSSIEKIVDELWIEDDEAPIEIALDFKYIKSLFLRLQPVDGFLREFSNLAECSLDNLRELPAELPFLKSLSVLNLLEGCRLAEGSSFEGLDRLQSLCLSAKSLPSGFSEFKGLTGLRSLGLSDWRGGTERIFLSLVSLEELRLDYARNTVELSGLLGCGNLARVHLASLNKLMSIGELGFLEGLLVLTLEDCPSIETLAPLFNHNKIEEVRLWGSTKVRDGNLRGLLDCPSLRIFEYNNRRHYNLESCDAENLLKKRMSK